MSFPVRDVRKNATRARTALVPRISLWGLRVKFPSRARERDLRTKRKIRMRVSPDAMTRTVPPAEAPTPKTVAEPVTLTPTPIARLRIQSPTALLIVPAGIGRADGKSTIEIKILAAIKPAMIRGRIASTVSFARVSAPPLSKAIFQFFTVVYLFISPLIHWRP